MPEIEKFTVGIESDIHDMLQELRRGLGDVEGALGDMGDAADNALDDVGDAAEEAQKKSRGLGRVLDSLKNKAISLGSAFKEQFKQKIFDSIVSGIAALQRFGQQAIALQADLEQAEITFTNILGGDQEAATAFLENLRKKANELKVSFAGATQFAKSILPDTTSVQQFNDLLTLTAIGAKDAGRELTDIIFAMNEAIAGGEFKLIRDYFDIPKETINRIKEADDVTGAFIEETTKLFEKRGIADISTFQGTLNDTISSIKSFGENLLLIASKDSFEVIRGSAERFLKVLEENKDDIEAVAAAIGDIAAKALDFISTNVIEAIENVDPEDFRELADSVAAAFDSAQLFSDVVVNLSLGDIIDDVTWLIDKLREAAFVAAQISVIVEARNAQVVAEQEKIQEIEARPGRSQTILGIEGFRRGLSEEEQAEVDVAGIEASNQVVLDALPAFEKYNESLEERRQKTEEATEATDADADALARVDDHLNSAADAQAELTAKIVERADELGPKLIDAQDARNQAVEDNEQQHTDTMLEIDADLIEKRLEINEDFNDKLEDLAEQTTDKRAAIFERTRERLAKLERDTDKKIAEEREDFNRDELRETEDHLDEVRKLRDRFEDNLEDAVRSRDARRIRDLRRDFERQQQEKSEDLDKKNSREQEDFDIRLQKLRENEQYRADEILMNQQKDLEQLAEHEARRQAKIEESRQEALARADEAAQEARDREDERFSERQELIEGWLDRELMAIAKSLADQKEVTSEEAAGVLQALQDVFGPGGNIDALMDEFESRRKRRMEITVDFKADGGESKTYGPGGPAGNYKVQQYGVPLATFAEGGSMVATQPTLALFGEAGPEAAFFTPLSQLRQGGDSMSMNKRIELGVNFSGSAPPGIRSGDRDQIAGVLVNALREAGIMRT